MARALLRCWLPSAPCVEGSCFHSYRDQRKSLSFALLWYLTGWLFRSDTLTCSSGEKAGRWAGAAEAGIPPRNQGQPSCRSRVVPCNQAGTRSTGLGRCQSPPHGVEGHSPLISIIMLRLSILPAPLFHSCQTLRLRLYIRVIGRWDFSLSRAE